jgi:hypothetical protein
MKLKDVVEILSKKDQNLEVNYIVVETDGAIVAMQLDGDHFDVKKVCKSFIPVKPK